MSTAKILVVDDEPQIRRLLRTTLTASGYQIADARSGDESDYLHVFINHLRKTIEANPAKPKYILTEPWVGYRFASVDNETR